MLTHLEKKYINIGQFKESLNRNINFFFLCLFPGEIYLLGEPALGGT